MAVALWALTPRHVRQNIARKPTEQLLVSLRFIALYLIVYESEFRDTVDIKEQGRSNGGISVYIRSQNQVNS